MCLEPHRHRLVTWGSSGLGDVLVVQHVCLSASIQVLDLASDHAIWGARWAGHLAYLRPPNQTGQVSVSNCQPKLISRPHLPTRAATPNMSLTRGPTNRPVRTPPVPSRPLPAPFGSSKAATTASSLAAANSSHAAQAQARRRPLEAQQGRCRG